MQNCYFPNAGLQNAGQFLPYQSPLQNYAQYPNIIGDGEVTSLVLPNGSFQYIFIPTFKRESWPPYALSPNVYNPKWNLNIEAWLVRNVPNSLPFYSLNQQLPKAYADQQICNPLFDLKFNAPALGYHNKFHFDQSTSTTDLHYFYPSIRYTNQSNQSANVQVDTPIRNTVYTYEVVCSKPCCCGKQINDANKTDKKLQPIDKCMCMDDIQEGTQTVKERKKGCQCTYQNLTSDKIMATFSDQAVGSNESCIAKIRKDESSRTESSTSYKGRRLRGKISPIKIIGMCKTSSCCNTTEEEA